MDMRGKTGKLVLTVMLVMLAAVQVFADEVTFTAQAPEAVVVGERFRITYKVNTRDAKGFRAPDMDGLVSITGPNTSTSTSTQIINGNRTTSSTITYTYTAIATDEGEIKLDGATITAGGATVVSNPLRIRVLPQDSQSQQQGQSQSRPSTAGGQNANSSQNASSDELFMLASVDKTTVYEQEALLLTFKVYASPSVNLTSISNRMPDLKNFHVQEVELPQSKESKLEHYNGRNYRTILWSQYVLFPQHSGDLEIPATTFESVISQRVQSNDDIDFFFNISRYVDVRKDLTTKPIKIHVNPLPAGKSDGFYGGVGEFSISSSINSTDVTANDAVTVRVILSGTGNLKLIKTPQIKFPQDFDIYDPKVENKYTIKNGRQTGNKVFEYLVIPRHAGTYNIPSLDFQYFDTKSGSYRTISTDSYTLNVAKGQGGHESQGSVSYVDKEDLKYVGQDVRFHTTPQELKSGNGEFFGTALFYICLAIPVLILAVLAAISRKRIADSKNAGRTKVKKAGSVATKRLKVAHKLLKNNRKDEFYDELMRALYGYFGDRLAIPVAELSKDNIANSLGEHNISPQTIREVKDILDGCEFARYAPGDDTGRMDRLYDEAVSVIGQIENAIR